MDAVIGVVVPARNEQESIAAVIADTRSALPDAHLVIVDDASRDDTAARAAEAGAIVVRLGRHLGYAEALRTGYRAALDAGATRIAQLDGDGQHRADDLVPLIDGLDHHDMVVGSRFLATGYPMSFPRRAGIEACRWMTRTVGGLTLTDPTSGMRALRRELAEEIASNGFPDGLTESSFLIRMHRAGHSIGEVPVTMHPPKNGSMHDGLAGVAHFGRIARATLRLALDRRRS